MFIEKLWQENPELVEMAINRIAEIDNSGGEWIEFECFKDGYLVFNVFDQEDGFIFNIYLNDYYLGFNCESDNISKYAIGWMKFMYKVYGDKYALQYISHRNKELDRFMANYEEKYNNETRKVLAELGMDVDKTQTK